MPLNRESPAVGLGIALAIFGIAANVGGTRDPGRSPNTPDPAGPSVRKDVPYVTTREDVVDEMLRMAAVTEKDLVYDLGCGDGRIVITAARKYGARGVGVDIDPVRIAESRANAEQSGVAYRVRFIEGDLFDVDLSQATVVTLYLLPSVNLRLRPRLEALRPGTRIVSHNYDLGDWEPVQKKEIGTETVYLWIIPEKPTTSR